MTERGENINAWNRGVSGLKIKIIKFWDCIFNAGWKRNDSTRCEQIVYAACAEKL